MMQERNPASFFYRTFLAMFGVYRNLIEATSKHFHNATSKPSLPFTRSILTFWKLGGRDLFRRKRALYFRSDSRMTTANNVFLQRIVGIIGDNLGDSTAIDRIVFLSENRIRCSTASHNSTILDC
jgi:hypothetical protein